MTINIIVKRKITIPTLRFVIKLQTYGRHINGEVPKLALMDREAPKEIMNSQTPKEMYEKTIRFIIEQKYFQ